MTLATLDGRAIARLTLQWPAWGLWWADVDLVDAVEVTGRVGLDVAGTAFSGTVVGGGSYNGRASYRLVAGAGGVSKALPEKGYVNTSGVQLAPVLAEAARNAGESMPSPLNQRLGPHYARAEGETLGDLLQRHAPQNWYAEVDGSLHFGARLSTTYPGSAPRVRVAPNADVIDLAVDTLDGLAPGVIVDDAQPATDLEICLTPERLTVRVYARKRANARVAALARIVRAAFPSLKYSGAYEYRVVTRVGDYLNLQPVRVASGMPPLSSVPMRPGVFGLRNAQTALPLFGSTVLVCFADNDPSRPQVFTFDSVDSPVWKALTALARPLAHIGDVAGPFPIAPSGLPSIVEGA